MYLEYEVSSAEEFREILLDGDFSDYAAACLVIRTKDRGIQPFILNDVQRYIDNRLESQKAETGRVRAIILKGRQEGVSTLIEGRFIRDTTTIPGIRAFILTHEQDATENLFEMAERFYENLPPFIKPATGVSNAKELTFSGLDSGYRIGTAGNKAVGRSQTIQRFHGSEVAFWPNAEEHTKGVFQAVPNSPDTEIILESTANGVDNYFHRAWKAAESGDSDFIAIFIPWFWMAEYQQEAPRNFRLTNEEHELAELYDLSVNQLYWRRQKIIELNAGEGVDSGEIAFKQEYPMNASEAFQFSGGDTLIKAEHCMRARKRYVPGYGPVYVGIDPSYGGDRFAVVWRQGPNMFDYAVYTGADVATFQQRLGICLHVLETPHPIAGEKPDMVSIDYAVGKDLVDELQAKGFGSKVRAVHFAEAPKREEHKQKWGNRRNQIYGLLKEWLIGEDEPVHIPDTDEFQADLCATPYSYDIYERKVLKKKDIIKKEYGFSPDLADAAALTFANPIYERPGFRKPKPIPVIGGEGLWKQQSRYGGRKANYDVANFVDPVAERRQELQEQKQQIEDILAARDDSIDRALSVSPTAQQNKGKYGNKGSKKR